MADEAQETDTRPGLATCREWIARIAAITVIVVLGVGLAATYSELSDERDAGVDRYELLLQLEHDNDLLQKDNDALRALLAKQSALLMKLSRGETVSDQEVREATTLPTYPSALARGPQGPAGPPGPAAVPSATPRPAPTVVPTPRPTPTPDVPVATPSPSPLLCVPLLNVCL